MVWIASGPSLVGTISPQQTFVTLKSLCDCKLENIWRCYDFNSLTSETIELSFETKMEQRLERLDFKGLEYQIVKRSELINELRLHSSLTIGVS